MSADVFTWLVIDFERGADIIVGAGIHPEVERRSISFGSVVIVRCQDLDDLSGWHVLRKHRAIVLHQTDKEIKDHLRRSRIFPHLQELLDPFQPLSGISRIGNGSLETCKDFGIHLGLREDC